MSDDDPVVTDQDLLDEQSYHALALDDVERFGRRAQTGEKCGQRFSETQISSAVGRPVRDRLQLRADCVLAPTQIGHAVAQLVERQKILLVGCEQALDILLQAPEITLKRRFSTFCRIDVACHLQPTVELVLDEAGILKQFEDLGPYNLVEQILADRTTMANRSAEPPPRIGTQTPIVIDLARARPRRCSVERVAAVSTAHQALHNTGHDSATRRFRFIGLQTLWASAKVDSSIIDRTAIAIHSSCGRS